MLSDMDMITHQLEGDIVVYPIADVHLGALEHCESEWERFLKVAKEENAYIILDGDLLNNGVRTCKFANPFDEVLRPREAKKRMVEYLEPLRGHLLCLVPGNHEYRTTRDSDQSIAYDIFAKLDLEHLYRENIAYMRIQLGHRPSAPSKPEATYTFAITHGSSGGIYTGAAVNSAERFGDTISGLDCLIVGHSHKGFVSKPGKIVVDSRNGIVKMEHYTALSCVSWLNYAGYAARKMLKPAYVCDPQKIHLKCDHHNKSLVTEW